jgi:Tfp pilus assembly protein PilO
MIDTKTFGTGKSSSLNFKRTEEEDVQQKAKNIKLEIKIEGSFDSEEDICVFYSTVGMLPRMIRLIDDYLCGIITLKDYNERLAIWAKKDEHKQTTESFLESLKATSPGQK